MGFKQFVREIRGALRMVGVGGKLLKRIRLTEMFNTFKNNLDE